MKRDRCLRLWESDLEKFEGVAVESDDLLSCHLFLLLIFLLIALPKWAVVLQRPLIDSTDTLRTPVKVWQCTFRLRIFRWWFGCDYVSWRNYTMPEKHFTQINANRQLELYVQHHMLVVCGVELMLNTYLFETVILWYTHKTQQIWIYYELTWSIAYTNHQP